jgi:hypothetical protein
VSLVAPNVSKTDRKCHFRGEYDPLTDLLASSGAKEKATKKIPEGGVAEVRWIQELKAIKPVNPAARRRQGGRLKIF